MEAKIQFKNERNRVESVKILEDRLPQRRTAVFRSEKKLCASGGVYNRFRFIISFP